MLALAALGAVAAAIYGGWSWLVGFLTGAAFSAANFWLFHRIVRRVGQVEAAEEGPRKTSAAAFAMRYLLFAATGYVIVVNFGASLAAALFGCFVAVAAVLLEIVVELIYGTS